MTTVRVCAYDKCPRNGSPFTPKTENQIYCNLKCNQNASASRRRADVQGEVEDPIAKQERIVERLREENRQLHAAVNKSRKDGIRIEEIREKCYELAAVEPNPPTWLHDVTLGGVPGVPITIWSDWHLGEVVNPEEVGYVNHFNSDIAAERVRRLVDSLIDLCFQHMVNPTYPGIVVNVAGDMLTGDIHEELQDTNDRYTFQTMLELQDLICAGIELLADKFGHVFVPWVIGNHGRNTFRPRMKGRAFTSFEWHLGCQVERHFRNDPRVQVLVSNEADAHYSVYDHRYLVTHGDSLGVKGGDGIIGSIGPIMRGAVKVGRAESQIGRDFDTLVMGHWHQYMSLPGVEVNGSLKGYDEYARLGIRAPYQRPTQALWFQHRKWGITAHWPIYLDPRETPENLPWVSWQGA